MPYTISTSVRGDARARRHNQRDRNVTDRESHIDPNGYYEILVDESEAAAYHRLFDQAVKEYNSKQTRADRKIKNYHAKIKADPRKHTSYEMVVCIGSKQNPVDPSIGYQAMKEFVSGWKDRNPNLELIGAYYHADEDGVPGWHLDFVPVAHNFKNGPSVQTALSRALVEEGYTGGDYYYKSGKKMRQSPQIEWERAENDALEDICKKYGLEIEHPERGQAVEHLNTPKYKEMQDEIQELKDQVKQLTGEKNQLDQDISEVEKTLDNALINTETRISNRSLSLSDKARILKRVVKETDAELSTTKNQKEKLDRDISNLEKKIDDALINAGINPNPDPFVSFFNSWHSEKKEKEMDLPEKINKLDTAVTKADTDLSKAKTKKENLQSDISALEVKKTALDTDITEKLNKADSEASETLQKANEEADGIIDKANSKAAQIINDAYQVKYHTINYQSVAAAAQAMDKGEVLKDDIYMIYPDSHNSKVNEIVRHADNEGHRELTDSELETIKSLYGYNGDIHDKSLSFKIARSGCYQVFTGRNFDGSYYAEDFVTRDVNSGRAQIFADVPQNQVVLPQTLLGAIIECLEEEPDLSDEILKLIKTLSGYLPDQQLGQSGQTLDETNKRWTR